MSWWVGLSRKELWIAAQTREFKYTRVPTANVDDDPSYRNPFAKANMMRAHRHETGFNMVQTGGIALTRDRISDDDIQPPTIPDEYGSQVQAIEADRAYREWNAHRYERMHHDAAQACDFAATLLVMLKQGRVPTDWTTVKETEFMRWCQEHQTDMAPMLELTE